MDRETAKAEVLRLEPDFLEPARQKVNGHTSYICPKCGNGSGSTGDGIALDPHSKGKRRYKCFVCGLNEDVAGLWKIHTGIQDDKEAFSRLYEYYGIQIEDSHNRMEKGDFDNVAEYQNHPETEQYTHGGIHTYTYTQKGTDSKMDYYRECQKHISETDYPAKRGLSSGVVAKYMLGYDPHYNKGTGGKEWRALIIPTGVSSYVARNTDRAADKKDRYRKNGSSQIYNAKEALSQNAQPVFIVEGEIDALSIVEVGGQAVGLGSVANYKKLLERIQQNKPGKPLILALDNDEDGQKTTDILAKELEAMGVPYYRAASLYGFEKDANSLLIKDRNALAAGVKKAIEEALSQQEEELEEQREAYLNTSTASHLQEFINGISDSVNTPYTPTGFTNLDEVLEGGLYEGLYILGAISSLGKTTLALQIADQIASAGGNVLIFSLEMARTELMAKSISRLTLLDVLQNKGDMRDAKTTRGITTGTRWINYSKKEKDLIYRAIKAYGGYAGNIYIHEGIGDIGTSQIRETVQKHIQFTGKKPVVLIDYVQILAPADVRATDKQNTDKAVLELKRLSRDFKIPVLGISSFNRANYSVAVTMEAFKESGSLEYGSDVLIGLQLKGAGVKGFDVNQAKQKYPREIELVVLKNRNGATGKVIDFEYYPLFNYFREV